MNLNKDFKEFIELLNSNNVEYLLIGGWSLAIYGQPRYTKDIDFFVVPSKENAVRVLKTLKQFGFKDVGLREADFITQGQIVQLGFEPNRIDLVTTLKGVDVGTAWINRYSIQYEDLKINVIALEDLIANKLAAGRAQDLADVQLLKKIKG